MKAKLTFETLELVDMIRRQAAEAGFKLEGPIEWGVDDYNDPDSPEGISAEVSVRPMTPEEKEEFDLDSAPLEERIYSELREIVEDVVTVVRQEHEDTRDSADNSVMEWLEPFRNSVGKIQEAVQKIQRGEVEYQEREPRSTEEERRQRAREEDVDDEFAEERRQRFDRLKREQEEEAQEVERGTVKGESTEFPEDMRVT